MLKNKISPGSTKIHVDWYKWGPYLSERQWGTVREDYSNNGDAWNYITHDMARSKAYRWGEEGIGGISDDQQILCFAFSFWNGKDPILKERFFGLSGTEGNHGEDIKEYYYYLENTPTHAYMKMLYKYPQNEFPYSLLVDENKKRLKTQPEYELIETGLFNKNEYFDIFIEFAKADKEDLLIKATVYNRSKNQAEINFIPHLWFRNTWSFGYDDYKPSIHLDKGNSLIAEHKILGTYFLFYENKPELLFCDNETNHKKLYNLQNKTGYFKDGINDYLTNNIRSAINPDNIGTKAALNYKFILKQNQSKVIKLRLSNHFERDPFNESFEQVFLKRIKQTDNFYIQIQKNIKDEDTKKIQRQALAGLLWSKQFYYYDIPQWLNGDPAQPKPPAERLSGRNSRWTHLNNYDIILMPDKWEYPWYAAWDLAFHCITIALVDTEFAKSQLKLLTKEWYMHPSGQLPAYEWNFSDVNPPVHAWAAWKIYVMDKGKKDKGDLEFLESVLHKLLLNFTWWVNRKDPDERNIFEGGFLGLDNIGVFDRNIKLPSGERLEQADSTSWMAMYTLNLLQITIELAKYKKVYEELATKFLEHFLYIAGAMTNIHGAGIDLWDNEDEFFYDVLHKPDSSAVKLKVRSIVGLIPLFAVEVISPEVFKSCPKFAERMEWFLNYRPDLANLVSRWQVFGKGETSLFSLLRGHRMKRLLKRMLDPNEFLSDYGIRALSKFHKENPYTLNINGKSFEISYEPGESDSFIFGGNSNWRGPIWFPVNYLLIESLYKFHSYYGDDFKVECPTYSGKFLTLKEIAIELSNRLQKIFLRNKDGRRAVFGCNPKFHSDPYFKDYLLFYEYFNGENGCGLGASHQTGWTALIANLIQEKNY